jgi:hypothetical protein
MHPTSNHLRHGAIFEKSQNMKIAYRRFKWHTGQMIYSSDDQLAARGPDPARSLIYSGPRQITGLVRLVKVSISA